MNAVYDLIAMNETLIWNDNKMKGMFSGNTIKLRGRDNGFEIIISMHVIKQNDYLVMYYCGE